MKATLFTDGGARGNPGPAGLGAVLIGEDGEVLAEVAEGIGEATNNVAEYRALIAGLELALATGVTDIDVRMDSVLVVSQVRGEWKIKNDALRPLAMRAGSLLNRFERASVEHVRREENAHADRLANEAMDAAELELDQRDEHPGQTSLLE